MALVFGKGEVPKFELGALVSTANAQAQLTGEDVSTALKRHLLGDWGELGVDDRLTNEDALQHGERLLSAYTSTKGVRFWIITEADRSVTTILLPEDY